MNENGNVRQQLIDKLAPEVAIHDPEDLCEFVEAWLNDNDWGSARKYWWGIVNAKTSHGLTLFTKDLRKAAQTAEPQNARLAAENARLRAGLVEAYRIALDWRWTAPASLGDPQAMEQALREVRESCTAALTGEEKRNAHQ